MERKNTDYSPIQICNEEGYAYFDGTYIWDRDKEVIEISGLEITVLEIPTDKANTDYLMKRIDDQWRISLKPDVGGHFAPLHTELTDKIIEFILNKHELFDRIHYPHYSHPYKQ